MSKNGILIVKYYKKGDLYSSQLMSPNDYLVEKQVVGLKNKPSHCFFGLDLSFDPKSGWQVSVNGRKRALSLGSKIALADKVTAVIEQKPETPIKLGSIEAEKVQKIQVVVLSSKNQYVFSDILPNKKIQKFSYAGTKLKIKRPLSETWEELHKDKSGYKISARQIFVPAESDVKTPVPFTMDDKELIRKIAYGYVATIAFFLLSYAIIFLAQEFLKDKTQYDVVKVDETLLEQKREKIFKEKQKVVPPTTQKVVKPKVVKAFEKSKKIVKGAPKKAIAKKTNKKSSGGGPKNKQVAVEGVKSNKMKITRGRQGQKGNFGQADQTRSKLSKLSGLSQGIGFNANSVKTANNLNERGAGGDFSYLRKGSPTGKKGFGLGGSGNGAAGMGSYKVGGLGTMSLGGSARGGGTGASLSKNKTGKGFIDGIEEEVIVVGGLDASVIKRIIKRNEGDIKYCYERRLNARPNLSGVFEAEFFIGANGSVQRSGSSRNTLGDSRLNNCINSSIKSWKFPKPVGGTVVKVNYPFILKSS